MITLRFDQALDSDGGSPAVSYHLQYMAVYTVGAWIDLSGGEVDSLLTHYTLSDGLEKGETYSFRYRVKNAIGWSDFSDSSSTVAADPPARPLSPPVVVGDPTASSLTLQFDQETIDDGGSPITTYLLEMCEDSVDQDQCLEDSQFSTVSSYTATYQHTLTAAADLLVPGSVYRLRYRAGNAVGGNGLPSDPVNVAIVDKPAASSLIQKNMEYSSRTSLSIEWSAVAAVAGQSPGGDILGYVLQATDPTNGTTWEAFNGVELGLRDQTRASVLWLTTGRAYQFAVVAHNFNGAGTSSETVELYSCVLPSQFSAPYRIGSSATSLEIGWTPPEDSGGCAITGYAVFKDDGTGAGTFEEANSVNDPAVRNQPGLNSMTITTFDAEDTGQGFVIYLVAYTEAGDSIESEHATITLGDVPDKPSNAPYKDSAASSGSRLLIRYDALAESANGGLALESYSLEIDDGVGGEFSILTGFTTASLATSHLVTTGISQGLSYRVRYRAKNAYGWSEYSETAIILAAQPPAKPVAAPQTVSTSDTTIQVLLDLDIENGGSPITRYPLEISGGGLSNDVYHEVTTDDGSSGDPLRTLDIILDELDFGTIYKLRYRAENVEGLGEYSDVALVALNALPVAPSAPTRVDRDCSETSIAVSWTSVQPDPELEGNKIAGYRLYVAEGQSNIFSLVYDGDGYPQITSTVVTNLSTGELYDFKVSAINANGEGPQSSAALRTHSCVAPSEVSAPVRVAALSTMATVTLSWEQPAATGGCPITGYALFRSDPDQSDPANGVEVYVEVNEEGDANIRDQPDLFEATVTNFLEGSAGRDFKYVVEAFNAIGGTTSQPVSYILATTPSPPGTAPEILDSLTSSTQITVLLTALVGDSQTGGATILSYGLQMSSNSPEEAAYFVDVAGTIGDSVTLQHTLTAVEKGESYAFRYRTKNQYGWSEEWSPVAYALAVDAPSMPPAPTFVEATDTSVTIDISLPLDDGGQSFTSLELWRDEGDQAESPTFV